MKTGYYKYSLPELFRNYRDLRAAGLEAGFTKRILETCFSVLFLGRYGGSSRTVRAAGYRIRYCDEGSFLYLFREIFLKQAYWFESANPAPYIIDCGANIGMASLYFKALYPGAEILAFEPAPEACAALKENIERNGLEKVSVRNEALLDRDGTTGLYRSAESPGSPLASVLPARMDGEPVKVAAARLSRYLDREVDFLKMDIEGAETEVLAELESSGKLPLVKQLCVEYHHHIESGRDSMSGILSILERSGFGYQIEAAGERPFRKERFQDVLIYAYKARGSSAV